MISIVNWLVRDSSSFPRVIVNHTPSARVIIVFDNNLYYLHFIIFILYERKERKRKREKKGKRERERVGEEREKGEGVKKYFKCLLEATNMKHVGVLRGTHGGVQESTHAGFSACHTTHPPHKTQLTTQRNTHNTHHPHFT